MKTSSLLFKRRISVLGLCLFIIVSSAKVSYSILKWSVKSIIKSSKWIRNYIHFVKSGYSYSNIFDLINNMSGREFEKFCYNIFNESGFKVTLTQASNDGGKDLILYNKEDGYTYVECKRWSGDGNFKVGRPELQKLVGSAVCDSIENMLFITTGKYSSEAYEYASKMENLILWDMTDIMKMVYKLDQKRIPYILMRSLDYKNSRIIRLKPCVK